MIESKPGYSDQILRRHAVLFVDDEAANRIVFQATFGPTFSVVCAADADEALEILASRPVAVMVTDERMPGLSGVELCEQVAFKHPTVRRILVTAWSDETTVMAAINRGGVSAFLKKPWVPEELTLLMRDAVLSVELDLTSRELMTALTERERLLAVDAFRGGVLHDISGRVGALTLAIEELEFVFEDLRGRLSAAEYNEAREPLSHARQAISFVTDVLSTLRRDRDASHGWAERFHLSTLLASVCRIAGRDAALSLIVTCPDELFVYADRIAIGRVLVNLIANARNAISESGRRKGEIRIIAGTDSGLAVIDVADDGPGVPASVRERIFDAAFTTRAGVGGHGFGLAISRELARRDGGDLWLLADPPDTGATFRLLVPEWRDSPASEQCSDGDRPAIRGGGLAISGHGAVDEDKDRA